MASDLSRLPNFYASVSSQILSQKVMKIFKNLEECLALNTVYKCLGNKRKKIFHCYKIVNKYRVIYKTEN